MEPNTLYSLSAILLCVIVLRVVWRREWHKLKWRVSFELALRLGSYGPRWLHRYLINFCTKVPPR